MRRRLAAIGGAALAAVVAMLGTAPAGAADQQFNFSGAGEALALKIEVSLPVQVPGLGVQQLVQKFLVTSSQITSEPLAKGVGQALEGALSTPRKTVQAKGEAREERDSALSLELPSGSPLLSAGAANVLVKTGQAPEALAQGSVTDVGVTLRTVRSSLPGEVTGAVDQVTQTVNGLVGQVNDIIGSINQQAPVKLPELPPLPSIIQTDLVSLKLLESSSRTYRDGEFVANTTSARLTNLSLLGGLVSVDAANLLAETRTNGKPGGASAKAVPSAAGLKIGSALPVDITGGTITVLGVPVDTSQLTQALAGVLQAAGVTLELASKSEEADPQGKFAKASARVLHLRVAPPGTGIVVDVDPVVTSAVQAELVSQPAPPPAGELPRTGQLIPAAAGLLGLAGAALVRRKLSHI